MSELKEISKKRKRLFLPTARSLMANFSRTKSQIHLHRNRPGQSLPDSSLGGIHQDPLPFLKKRKNSSPLEGSSVVSSVSIKDLLSRRVFSPHSTNGVIPTNLDDTKSLGKSEVAGNCLDRSKEAGENGDFEWLGMSNEDFLQSTPPDAEMFGAKQVMERNGSDFSDEKKPIKTVLKPFSGMKLLKTPASFSYRRLLPYLMDIEKDYSRSPLMGHCQRTDKGLEDKQLLASNSDTGKELNTGSVEPLTSQDNESSSMPLVNEEIQTLELKMSGEDQNLNCLKHDSLSTVADSHLKKENLAGVGSSDIMLTDDCKVVITNVETPCNAQTLEGLDQTFPTITLCQSCDYDKVTRNSEIEGMPEASVCHSFEVQHHNSVNPTLSELEGNRKFSLQQRVHNGAEFAEQVEDLNGECISVTPVDSDMPSRSETDNIKGNRMDCLSQDIDHSIEKSTNETFGGNNGQDSDKSIDSSPKNKLVPNPRLHLKLSKVSNSFNYRRLLPFLMDITNDYSCASGNNQTLKAEKSAKEIKLLSPFFISSKDNGNNCPVDQYNGDDVMLPVATEAATRCSSNHKLTQSPPKQVAESPKIMDSEQEHLVKNAAMDSNQKVETSPENVIVSPAMPITSLTNSGLLPREEDAKLVSYQLTLETEEHCIMSTIKCANSETGTETNSFVEAAIPPRIPVAGLKKGILRRNPRGCRGICTCLNCSSFLFHAERSFEFSRNQMQDAEEVALNLIKELSFLRSMLEKSAPGAKDQPRICIDQVKEACKKAFDAEEVAKTRLSEMNNNLNVHCRIPCGQRPNVRFSNYVQELDSSNN